MLLIVAHHYVVHGGVFDKVIEGAFTPSSTAILIFGAWGKTGINCFVMITGWFMSRSRFTWKKFINLYIQIVIYAIVIYLFFCFSGQETFKPIVLLKNLFPICSVSSHFVSAFLLFYLLIPFINILIDNTDKKQHASILLILLMAYTVLPTNPWFELSFNYISWFSIIYLIAAFIRKYGLFDRLSHRIWGIITIVLLFISSITIYALSKAYFDGNFGVFRPYLLLRESNQLLPLLIGISSFMFFKELKIPHSRFINLVGATTFGILLIHDNSMMRSCLWKHLVDSAGHVTDSLLVTIGYATGCVLLVFVTCSGIDWLRGKFMQPNVDKFVSRKL